MKLIEPEFLETLYKIRTVGKYQIVKELAKILGEDVRSVLYKINILLKGKYFKFSIDYSLSELGLKLLVIITNKNLIREESTTKFMKFVKAIAYVFPNKHFYSLYMPLNMQELPQPLKIDNETVVIELHERLRNKTSFTTYSIESVFSPEKGFSKESFNKLEGTIKNAISNLDRRKVYIEDEEKITFDAIDLGIIKELEKNAFVKQVDIARALGISIGKLRRHAKLHVPYLIKGIRLMDMPLYPEALETSLFVLIKSSSPNIVRSLCEALVTHPTVVSCAHRNDVGLGMVQFVIPFSMVQFVVEFLEKVGLEYGFEVSRDMLWLANIEFSRRFTLPYKRWEEYVPKMSWNIDELRRFFSGFGETS
ncbi:MAG: winged helix-turn-helix transcriptional regulator [Desulfurococcaceae archaeon TW002]